jgi:hypothetical protein
MTLLAWMISFVCVSIVCYRTVFKQNFNQNEKFKKYFIYWQLATGILELIIALTWMVIIPISLLADF